MPKIYDYLGIVFYSIQTNTSRYTFTQNLVIAKQYSLLFLKMAF